MIEPMQNRSLDLKNLQLLRSFLENEFKKRRDKNQRYSVRAFSKYLDLDQSFVSKLLNGSRPITETTAKKLAPKLGITAKDLSHFLISSQYQSLSDDQIKAIGDWKHFAIIELAKTKNFKFEIPFIMRRLNATAEEVTTILARLERLGMIEITDREIKILSRNTNWSKNTKETSAAKIQMQKSLIEESLKATLKVPFSYRDNTSVTVAINKSRMPELKEKLRQITMELAEFLQPSHAENDLDEVYQLTLALFPLSKFPEIS